MLCPGQLLNGGSMDAIACSRHPAAGRRSEAFSRRMPVRGIQPPDAGHWHSAAGCRPVPAVCSLNKMSGLWLDCGYIRMAVRAGRVWQFSPWRRFLSQHGGDAYGMHGCGQVCEPARGAGGIEVVGKIKGSHGLPLIISVLEYAAAASERRRGCARSRWHGDYTVVIW